MEWTNYVIGGRECAKHIDRKKDFAHAARRGADGHICLYKVSTHDQLVSS